MKATAKVRLAEIEDTQEDGRRLRASRSRRQIVEAMMKLILEGDMAPSAARVAEMAGVSLRTVFRHFEEMDSLNQEMSAIVESEVRPLLARPIEGEDWRERLRELLARRTAIYERIMPLKIAGSIRRFRSPFLREAHERFIVEERESLSAVLPAQVRANATLSAALEMASAFEAWRRLRQDQGLDPARALEVMDFVVSRIAAEAS